MISKDIYAVFNLKQLSKKRAILRKVFSFVAFLDNKIFTHEIEKTLNKYKRTLITIGKFEYDNIIENVYFKPKYPDKLIVDTSRNNQIIPNKETFIYDYLNEMKYINDAIFQMIMNSVESKFERISNWNYDLNEIFKSIVNNKKINRFLLGTGVSSAYGAKNWKKLCVDMENKIKFLTPSISTTALTEDFFNNNYGVPQILKNIDIDEYYNVLYDSIYDGREFKSMPDENLFKIANYLKRQFDKGNTPISICTFNYDNFLEKELEGIGFTDYASEYKNMAIRKSIIIKHVHGFFPERDAAKISKDSYIKHYSNSIVLTEEDYQKSYQYKKYTYETLKAFLQESTLIVGNSMGDYEERKLFRSSPIMHVRLDKKSGNKDNDAFIFQYCLDLNIITIFYDDYDQIGDYIDSL